MDPDRAANPGHLRRRNGRRQACEPCRSRKVACDHSLPTCQRCRTRKTTDKCVYLVHGRPVFQTQAINAAANDVRPSRASARETRAAVPLATDLAPSHRTAASDPWERGYLGATSFSAVLQETQTSLLMTQSPVTTPETSSFKRNVASAPSPSKEWLETAIMVLRSIPNRHESIEVFKDHVNPNDGWCRLAAEVLLASLWSCFGESLEGNQIGRAHV